MKAIISREDLAEVLLAEVTQAGLMGARSGGPPLISREALLDLADIFLEHVPVEKWPDELRQHLCDRCYEYGTINSIGVCHSVKCTEDRFAD